MALRFRRRAAWCSLKDINGSSRLLCRQFSTTQRTRQAEPAEPPSALGHQGGHNGQRVDRKQVGGKKVKYRRVPLSSVVRSADKIELVIDGETHVCAPLFLRDLCTCPRCVDQSTRQKHFSTADIPAEINAEVSYPNPDAIHLRWTADIPGYEDHETDLPLELLRRLCQSGTTNGHERLPRTLWDSRMFETQTTDVDYESYMNDDSTLLRTLQQLHAYGLAFITNVPEDEASVQTLGERIGPLKTTFYGKTWDVRSVPDAINVAYTAQNLGFHMDLMYMEQPPHLQLLHCIRSSAAGGASLFCDSFRAVDELGRQDIRSYRSLASRPVDFHYDHPGSQYYHQSRPVIEEEPRKIGHDAAEGWNSLYHSKLNNGSNKTREDHGPESFIKHVSWAPPFQAPFSLPTLHKHGKDDAKTKAHADDTQNLSELARHVLHWHQGAQKFNYLIHRPEVIYERMMKPGECVIFDNRRVLHARRAFEVGDAGKERWLRGAYLDRDPYMSRLKTLTDLERKDAASEEFSADSYFEAAAAAA
ncbi:Gamma-butyrobetaine dioxygenase [Lecanosticta acicola]|uniref:Gamma-butyrobetaine dioxygenase n=1 Tax=Lecanosticta acicola TaxID=111012 RepID=A0AAI9EBG1_9PEZI|nr:Gamma-butyrobetaine dioxygenase [Lecanosticta acicola]